MMLKFLWLVPALPLAGFLLLTLLSGFQIAKRVKAIIGVGAVGLSALLALMLGVNFLVAPPVGHTFTQIYWTWIGVGNFDPQIGFHLDALALVMVLVVTVVGFLIHLYLAEFMKDEEGYGRFFAYMNLFVGMMLITPWPVPPQSVPSFTRRPW